MAVYRIHVPLQDFEGAKTGKTYTCTRDATYRAPEGEFKDLAPGAEYSRIDQHGSGQEPTPDTESDD
jgi:hypothetical protein